MRSKILTINLHLGRVVDRWYILGTHRRAIQMPPSRVDVLVLIDINERYLDGANQVIA